MILPIFVYGQPVLRKKAEEINPDYPALDKLLTDMWETMDKCDGVGLAAPQIGVSVRLFVIDAGSFSEDYPETDGFRKAFINPEIEETFGEEKLFNEGCLSLPSLREDVKRNDSIKIKYCDENFQIKTEEYSGILARIIQHEYDHLEGKMFIDRLSPLRRRLLKKKLDAISIGKVDVAYKIKIVK